MNRLPGVWLGAVLALAVTGTPARAGAFQKRAAAPSGLTAAGAGVTAVPALPAEVRAMAQASLERGVAALLGKQLPDGSWMKHPAITSLVCAAIAQSQDRQAPKIQDALNRGLDYVVKEAKPDGSIWNKDAEDYPNYSTAVSLIALAIVNRPQDEPVLRAAREFLLNSQFTDEASKDGSYGGIGYGKAKRPDLSNTQWALEALYVTDYLDREPFSKDPGKAKRADLAWDRAIQFLNRCQNLKETNDQVWVAADPVNRGGFVYMPGESKAGAQTVDGIETLRSYGSMTYAGLKSMLYSKVAKDDPRVQAAVAWLSRNFTFAENPGMGSAGLYYYLHTSAKALAVLGEETLKDAKGKPHAWRTEIIRSLVARQQPNGEWANENSRWWENMPELTTSYAVVTLRFALGQDPYARRGPASALP